MEYTWNGTYMPGSAVRGFTLSGSHVPNSFSVGDFGVAVNAKYDRFGCWPRTRVMYSAGSSSSSGGAALTPSACLSRAAASPPCEEWASSMITAYRLPPSAAFAILSSTYGYFCSVIAHPLRPTLGSQSVSGAPAAASRLPYRRAGVCTM
jgi:hypothetical protein